MGKVKIGNFKGPKGDTGAQGPTGPQGPEGPQGPMGEVDANTQIVFTQATSRENIASGEKLNIILGKIRKWFADIKAAAFQDVSNALTTTVAGYVLDARQGKILDGKIAEKLAKTDVVNGLTETAEGKALDARQGKALNEKIDDTNEAVSELNRNLDTNITTSESETHELYENQRIYTKYVDCKALPNAGNKVYNLDIPSGFAWIDLSNSYVYPNAPSLRTIFPLNYHNEKTGSSITFSLNENDKTITFGTADDWSAYNAAIVIKYYKY